jgi:hypothetical protein
MRQHIETKETTMRIDYKRSAEAKARTMTRRNARRIKSATLFLAWAFPAPAFPTNATEA